MILRSSQIAEMLEYTGAPSSRELSIVPSPRLSNLKSIDTAAVDLRLGRWFRSFRQSRTSSLKIGGSTKSKKPSENRLTREYFVRFGDVFFLHPGKFILGITLEWLHLPNHLAAYVTGKSSLGRRGLIIETAAGIHPGFAGCLALEMTNLGEVPIELVPGMEICQIFLHEVSGSMQPAPTQFSGFRKPYLGSTRKDPVLEALSTQL